MAFANANNFVIGTLNAVDGRALGEDIFHCLVQKACLGAGHRSNERYDAPKCHPETRKAVIRDIMSWIDSKVATERIMWMSGPAGAGKSSIAQTVCERCHKDGKLLASFFFSRTATGTGRDDGSRLVPTIACQLATVIPESKSLIIQALQDPSLFSYSMAVQMEKLVLEPLSEACANIDGHSSNNARFPYLVVIDGLDECNDLHRQSKIITITANIISNMNIRMLRFLIVSRPELEIRNTFKLSSVSTICSKIVLNNRYKPDDDIHAYLQSEFSSLTREHTLSSTLLEDHNWPTSDVINVLVSRSSGQFIYASTVMKCLKDPRRDPRGVLKSIIGNSNTSVTESPFAQLDRLYTQILNTAVSNLQGQRDSIILIFQVLLYGLYPKLPLSLTPKDKMASFISINQSELELLLSDLHSIMLVPISRYPGFIKDSLRFYHASFKDFLMDSSRSGEFYIDKTEAHKVLAHRCFKYLSECRQSYDKLTHAERYSCNGYFSHIEESDYNEALLTELCSTSDLQKIVHLVWDPYGSSSSRVSWHDKSDQFNRFFRFHCSGNGKYCLIASPINGKCEDICNLMSGIIDELYLSHYSSLESFLLEIIDVVTSPEWHLRHPRFRKCWLAMLMQHPTRGRHLYLDSEKSLQLYIRLCNTSEFHKFCGDNLRFNEFEHVKILKYLLSRIRPSAITDTNAFREMSKQVANNERLMVNKKAEVESFLQSVDEFIVRVSSASTESSCIIN